MGCMIRIGHSDRAKEKVEMVQAQDKQCGLWAGAGSWPWS